MKEYKAKDLFSDWYQRAASIKIADDELANIALVNELLLKENNYEFWFDLLRIVYGLPPKSSERIDQISVSARKHIEHFPITDNMVEIRRMCTCLVPQKIDERSRLSDALALAYMTYSFARENVDLLVPDTVEYAIDYWIKECVSVREKDFNLNAVNKKFAKITFKQDGTIEEFRNETTNYLKKILSQFDEISSKYGEAVNQIDLLKEELDFLWWLFGESSRDTGLTFKEMKSEEAILQMVKECIDLTQKLPGLEAIDEIFYKVVKQSYSSKKKEKNIAELLDNADEKYLKPLNVYHIEEIKEYLPILTAFQRKMELGIDSKATLSSIKNQLNLELDQNFPIIEIMKELYLEVMLSKSYQK